MPTRVQSASKATVPEHPGAGLYVHVPFCEKLCHYCDFNTYLLRDGGVDDYLTALEREIALYQAQSDVAETTFETMFIGGGTPTALTAPQLSRLLAALRGGFSIAADAEITVEANPGTLIDSRLQALLDGGVNRLSIGVQSLNDELLRTLGRIHNARQAADCYERARGLGFDNISLDLMFGLPGQDPADWERTLTEIVTWQPEHLSCYGLIVEQGTLFGEMHDLGQLPLPGEDFEVEMYRFTLDHLAEHGYEHYEIANWARPGKQSRHNRIYWLNGQWLGLGPGAHSQWGGKRFANVRLPSEYAALTTGEAVGEAGGTTGSTEAGGLPGSSAAGGLPIPSFETRPALRTGPGSAQAGRLPIASSEDVPVQLAMEDTLMLGLRLREGVDAVSFRYRFGVEMTDRFAAPIDYLTEAGLLEWAGSRLRLTDAGLFVANQVFERFIS